MGELEKGATGEKEREKKQEKKGGGPNRPVSEHKGNEAEKKERKWPKSEGKE